MNERIRMKRLLLAGLAAGLILNVGEALLHGGMLGSQALEFYEALNRTAAVEPANLALLISMTFAQGVLLVALSAALRPRFRSRLGTAAAAGLAVWFLSSVYAAVYLQAGFPGIFPPGLVWLPVAWQLAEFPLAALAGMALYGEPQAAAAMRAG
jgi:hypothetical protein